jgi:hypothetical protein
MQTITALSGTEAATWLGTAAAVGAVLVAVWFQWGRPSRRRPRLTLVYDDTRDRADVEQRVNPPQQPDLYRSHWVRPRVANAPRRDSAEDVEVSLFSVEARRSEPGRSPETARERLLEGRPLKWSEVNSAKASLPPGADRRFDLLHVDNMRVEADGETIEDGAPIRFDIFPVPEAKYHRAFGNSYKVTIALTARDLEPTFYSTEVTYDLDWHETTEAMRAALTVADFKGPGSEAKAV